MALVAAVHSCRQQAELSQAELSQAELKSKAATCRYILFSLYLHDG